MPDIEVLKTYPYKGSIYHSGDAHKGAPEKFAQLMIRVGKARLASPDDKTDGGIVASDAVKSLAKEQGVNLLDVKGSGVNGRINKKDIETYKTRVMVADSHQEATVQITKNTQDAE